MIITMSSIEGRVSGYTFLKPEIQQELVKSVLKAGKPFQPYAVTDRFEINDNSPLVQVFNSIDKIVDTKGLCGINWINANGLKNIQTAFKVLDRLPLTSIEGKEQDSGFLERYLISIDGYLEDLSFLQKEGFQTLDKVASNDAGLWYAKAYLGKNGPNRRVHITDTDFGYTVVWIRNY